MTPPYPHPARVGALAVIGIVALALNMRPSAVSVGPVLTELVADLGLNGVEAGLLTSLPVLAFALFGAVTPQLARRVGPHRLTVFALVAAFLGLIGRSLVDQSWAFLTLSLVALSGMAAVNVLMPSLVREHFPNRIGLLTAVYTTAMSITLTAAGMLTVPISEAFGSWRYGLAAWAIFAVVALGPWLALARHDRATVSSEPAATISFGQVARTRIGWALALMFAAQSTQAYAIFGWIAKLYRDSGFSATDAGLLLGVVAGVGIPLSFLIPTIAVRAGAQLPTLIVLLVSYLAGFVGLLVAPYGGAVAWAILLGIGASTFPLILTLISLRARTSAGTTALSGFTQSVGYLLSAVGPFAIGLLHDATGGWTVPIITLAALLIPLGWAATIAIRSGPLEDELARR